MKILHFVKSCVRYLAFLIFAPSLSLSRRMAACNSHVDQVARIVSFK